LQDDEHLVIIAVVPGLRGKEGPRTTTRSWRGTRRSPGIAFAGAGQHQDASGKIIHAAPNTTSNIFAKSISKDGGRGS
jgi:Fe-S cluster assembly scaffold protein SufB